MKSFISSLAVAFTVSTLSQGVFAAPQADASSESLSEANADAQEDTASRNGNLLDVAIIGGGSSGLYAGVRLKDLGKKVAVIERQDYPGGHFETFKGASGIPIELGARIFADQPIVRNYFGRFNIPLETAPATAASNTTYADFRSGQRATYTPPSAAAQGAALQRYAVEIAKYPNLSDPSKITYPVPADLLLPFRDFVVKYNLQDALPVFDLFCQGWGEFLNIPTLYVIIYANTDLLTGLFTNAFLVTVARDSSLLPKAAAAFLGNSFRPSTTVTKVLRRPNRPVLIQLSTPNGNRVIAAKKILSAFPQVTDNFAGWDLNNQETGIWSAFKVSTWYIAALRNSGIPRNSTFRNVADNTPFKIAPLPSVYNFVPSADPNLPLAYFGSQTQVGFNAARNGIFGALNRLRRAGTLPAGSNQIATIVSHGNYEQRVTADEIKNGFYKGVYALQGKRNTYYTGAGLVSHQSSRIWSYTDTVITDIVNSL